MSSTSSSLLGGGSGDDVSTGADCILAFSPDDSLLTGAIEGTVELTGCPSESGRSDDDKFLVGDSSWGWVGGC